MSNSYNISNCVIVFINRPQRVIQRLVNHLEINSLLVSSIIYYLRLIYRRILINIAASSIIWQAACPRVRQSSHHLHSYSRELYGQHPIYKVKHHKWQWEANARPPVHLRLHRFDLFFRVGPVLHKLRFRLSSAIKAKPGSSPGLGMSIRLYVSVHDAHEVFLFWILWRVKQLV